MAQSDNTSFANVNRAESRLAPLSRHRRRGLLQNAYREDVVAGLCLAAVVWLLHLLGGLLQP